ncbi:biotin/lipoyl-containing protein [Candidatus Thiosymbion oneisti]|uniref:biotin/lipoyl-containing protein n=1 Tax=Candidatus Thiosymbion oneisti TaxID=589554 RepID=UPI00105C0902|nr:biotin/lipoyl-containing protein [Candidatus Thiosymbion oneisti]
MRMFRVVVDRKEYEVAVEEIKGPAGSAPTPAATAPKPAAKPRTSAPATPKPSAPPAGGDLGEGTVVAQMPGTIVDIDVNVGDKVTKGQKLLVLEAMKMENEIVAPHDGTVSEISVAAGTSVNIGNVLVVLS